MHKIFYNNLVFYDNEFKDMNGPFNFILKFE